MASEKEFNIMQWEPVDLIKIPLFIVIFGLIIAYPLSLLFVIPALMFIAGKD